MDPIGRHFDAATAPLIGRGAAKWVGKIVSYREHLGREHCNVDRCGASADVVSFGYRDPNFTMIGARLGVCRRHRGQLGRVHLSVEDLRKASRR